MAQLVISPSENFSMMKYWNDRYSQDNTFSTARGASTGTASGAYVGCEKSGTPYFVYRNFTSYDTSSIPDDATIDSATITFINQGKDTSNDYTIGITTHTGGDTSFGNDDFNNITLNSPTELASRTANVSTFGASATITFTLNASGLAAISKTGYTKFCFRSSKDIDNSTPTARSYCSMGVGTFTINYTAGTNYTKDFTENIVISDSIVKATTRSITDGVVNLSDILSNLRPYIQTFTDSITTLDSFRKLLNNSLTTIWSKGIKQIGNIWGKTSRIISTVVIQQ